MNNNYTVDDKENIILEAREKHVYTLIWLHGLGDSAYGFLDIFDSVDSPVQQNTKVILLTAPVRPVTINKGYRMTSWFDIKKSGTFTIETTQNSISVEEIQESEKIIKNVMEQEIEILGDSTKLFIGGFSQGCCMALHCGLGYSLPIGGIIGLSGFIFGHTQVSQANQNIQVLYSLGNEDELVPLQLGKETCEVMKKAGVQLQESFIDDQEHEVSNLTLDIFQKFYKNITNQ